MKSVESAAPRDKYQIHEHGFVTATKHDLKKYKNYVSFAVIRNPYERILSCYRDKIVNDFQSLGRIHHGLTRYNTLLNRQLFHKDMEFCRFLEVISKIPDYLSDEHFRSQSSFLPIKNMSIKVDYLLEIESLSVQFNKMAIRENLPQLIEARVNNSGGNSSNHSLNEMDYLRMNTRYSLDLRLLPYKTFRFE